jgi:hypothetical protein
MLPCRFGFSHKKPHRLLVEKGNNKINSLLKKLPGHISVERRKVKYARIQVLPTGQVVMVVPLSCRGSQIVDFYQTKRTWVERKIEQFSLSGQQAQKLKDDELLLFGEAYRLIVNPAAKIPSVNHAFHSIEASRNLLDEDHLVPWYKREAKRYFSQRLELLAQQHGFDYNKLTIRSQKTRWGSCSSRKNISLNWKLVKVPVFVSDYVMLHELVHTRIMNHSAVFWGAVAGYSPDYQDAKTWLKQFGPHL